MNKYIFKEHLSEYESLRNELNITQERRANLILYMYLIYMTVFLIGVQYSKACFLITYIVLISFQARINRQRYMLIQMSAYIRIFFEDERNDLHWEHSKIMITYRRNSHRRLISRISSTTPVQLGILSLICYVGYSVRETISKNNIVLHSAVMIAAKNSNIFVAFADQQKSKAESALNVIQHIPFIDRFFIILSLGCTVLLGVMVKSYRVDYYPEMDQRFKEYKEALRINKGYIRHKNST